MFFIPFFIYFYGNGMRWIVVFIHLAYKHTHTHWDRERFFHHSFLNIRQPQKNVIQIMHYWLSKELVKKFPRHNTTSSLFFVFFCGFIYCGREEDRATKQQQHIAHKMVEMSKSFNGMHLMRWTTIKKRRAQEEKKCESEAKGIKKESD